MGVPDWNSGAAAVGIARLGDVEPPRLPPFHDLCEGAVKLSDVRHLAHHGASALRLLAAHDLRLHAEDLQPQAEMRLDAEESLAHDDERRDVEDEVRGQIMEVQPIIEHEAADKWMEGKPQSAGEVVEEDHPLLRFWGRDDLPCGWQPVRDLRG